MPLIIHSIASCSAGVPRLHLKRSRFSLIGKSSTRMVQLMDNDLKAEGNSYYKAGQFLKAAGE